MNNITNKEDYVIYVHVKSQKLIAIKKNQLSHINKLQTAYKEMEKIPSNETIAGIVMKYNSLKNTHEIPKQATEEIFLLNELSPFKIHNEFL